MVEYPFESKFVNLNGFNCHYVDEGCGEKNILMLHGNPTWSFYFRHLIKTLSKKHRAVAIDHIGCGFSEKPSAKIYDYTLQRRIEDLEIFAEKTDIKEKINLIVHDWGGIIGMGFALKHIDKIESLTITNTAAFFTPETTKIPLRLFALKKSYPLSYFLIKYLNVFARSAIYMATSKKLSIDAKKGLLLPYKTFASREAIFEFVNDIPLKESDRSYNTVLEIDKNLEKLSNIPMLICWGKNDFVFNVKYFEEWKKRFPEAKSHLFENAGHYLFEDEKEETAKLIANFLG